MPVTSATPRSFASVWSSIEAHAGEEFHTVRGLPFIYTVNGNTVTVSRTRYNLSRSDFEKAYQVQDLTGPGQLNDIVRGPAFVYAILTDPRI